MSQHGLEFENPFNKMIQGTAIFHRRLSCSLNNFFFHEKFRQQKMYENVMPISDYANI